MKVIRLPLLFFCAFFTLSAHSMSEKPKACEFDAIVFDIGSGASKSYRYNVDFCEHELNFSVVDSKVIHMQYQECISKSDNDDEIPKSCLEMSENTVSAFKDYYNLDCAKNVCMGVATAWARNAENSDKVIKFYKKNGIHIEIIDQAKEGILSFEAAMKVIDDELKPDSLVLDLGGGSHQVSYYDKNGNIEIYLGGFGNANFYRSVKDRFGIDYLYQNTSGYFKKEVLPEVMAYAKEVIGKPAKEQVTIEYSRMYGLGRSIYNYLVENLGVGPSSVTKEELKDIIYSFSSMSQKEAIAKFNLTATSFAPYMQTSLILMYSLLESLELNELDLLAVRMTDTVLLNYLKDRNLRGNYYR